jgi:hypothetical protein
MLKGILTIALIAVVILCFPTVISIVVWFYHFILSIKLSTWILILAISVILYFIFGND